MFTVFEEVNGGKYQRPFTSNSSRALKDISELITFSEDGFPIASGTVIQSVNRIKLENVPIITPNFDVVVPTLSLVVS
jgi:AGAP002071-PA